MSNIVSNIRSNTGSKRGVLLGLLQSAVIESIKKDHNECSILKCWLQRFKIDLMQLAICLLVSKHNRN